MPHTLLVPISRPMRGVGGGEHRCRDGVANRGQSSTATRPGSIAHVAALILDDVRTLDAQPLHVPMPRDKRLRTACAALLYGPGRPGTLAEWSDIAGASSRTLARLSASETGTRFVDWRHQARLPDALVRLARGQDVAPVSLRSRLCERERLRGDVFARRSARPRAIISLIEPCLVGMEACATSHHWARKLTALGHAVKLMPRPM
jgi:AraC-like DNA-binding protein